MGEWRGIMTANDLEMPVTVIYELPSSGMGKWYGSGVTDKPWPRDERPLETNIGTVIIRNQTVRANGMHFVDFKGVGEPKGPLGRAIGIRE